MATKNGNIAPMPAISRPGSANGTAMTAEQFDREKRYQAALSIARDMLRQGVLDEADFLRVEAKLAEKFRPIFGGFFC